MQAPHTSHLSRRNFIAAIAGTGAAISFGGGMLGRVLATAAPRTDGLTPIDLPDGGTVWVPGDFDVRVVGKAFQPVGSSSQPWHPFPDGAACVERGDGGWSLISNAEMPLVPPTGLLDNQTGSGNAPMTGGVTAMDFAADGTILGARRLLDRTYVNCAGGLLPDGRWLSCEEWDAGLVWVVDPTGANAPYAVPGMGQYAHEAVGVEVDGSGSIVHLYLTEDEKDGLFYRYTPTSDDLLEGTLAAMAVDTATMTVSWIPIADSSNRALDYQDEWMSRFRSSGDYPQGAPLRARVPGAYAFAGGEGCWYADGHVYFTTKKDDRVWDLHVPSQTLSVLVGDPIDAPELTPESQRPINSVDNLIVAPNGTILVAQDHFDLNVIAVDAETGATRPAIAFTGDGHYRHPGIDPFLPEVDSFEQSEVSGLAFNPDGTRLYVNSQRYDGFGITYEISGDWASFTV